MCRLISVSRSCVLITLALCAGCATSNPQPDSSRHQNILLIVVDNQNPVLLGTYGNPEIATPNIDRLAASGTTFDNAYAVSGVCSPTRATLLSGLIPSQHGIHNALQTDPARIGITDWSPLAEFATVPSLLGDAGYQTALVGKFHLGTHDRAKLGFQHWVTMETGHTRSFVDTNVIENGKRVHVTTHITDYWTDKAIEYLRRRDPSRPFFLMLAYSGPYILPPVVTGPSHSRFAEQYQDKQLSFPQLPVHEFLRNWAISSQPSDHMQTHSTHAWAAINALNNPQAFINTAAETSHVDAEVGRLMSEIEALNLDSNTLVIYTSDQGASFGQHGLWGNTSWAFPFPAYDSHLKVPLIVRQPGSVTAGQRTEQAVSQVDLFPTLLAAAGLDLPVNSPTTGQDISPLLTGQHAPDERPVFFEFITVRGVRSDGWKLIKRFPNGPNELYDLVNDPGEEQNLIGKADTGKIESRLSTLIDDFFRKNSDPRFDLWQGGTGKGRLLGDYGQNSIFESRFPNWRKPYIENPTPYVQ